MGIVFEACLRVLDRYVEVGQQLHSMIVIMLGMCLQVVCTLRDVVEM